MSMIRLTVHQSISYLHVYMLQLAAEERLCGIYFV